MIVGLDLSQRVEYSLKDDTDPKTVFVFKPLSGAEAVAIQASAGDDGIVRLKGDDIVNFLDACIVEIRGYGKKDIPKRNILNELPMPMITELMTECSRINRRTRQEEKN